MDIAGSQNVASLLRQRVEEHPEKLFLLHEDDAGHVIELTYRQFSDKVNGLAGHLAKSGVRPQHNVAVMLSNCSEFLQAWFAINQIGAVMVPVNVLYSPDELSFLLQDAQCVGLITEPEFLPKYREVEADCPEVTVKILARADEAAGGFDLLAEIDEAGAPCPQVAIAPGDCSQIIYTSGTTSRPKGAILSHHGSVIQGIALAQHFGLKSDERTCVVLPLFHVNGQFVSVIPTLTVGGTIVLLQSYSASRFWSQVRRHRCTFISIVPMILRTLLAQPAQETDTQHSVRMTFYALPTSDAEWTAFESRYAVRLIEGYGLSETFGICTANPVLHGRTKRHCIGLPVMGREIRVIDDDWNDVPTGQSGGIVVRGAPLFSGYFRNEEATRACMRDGWLTTGDNGSLDEDGYLHFLDRSKDVIKRAGENIAAGEVERVLSGHPAVAECAVIGVFDPLRDEAVKAVVVVRAGMEASQDELGDWCAKSLAKFKVPTLFEFRDALPKTSIGKIMKYQLRAEHAAAHPH
ncbi:class I adenylate-forming enzyme family protein [Pseudohoeflea coraliihabitans]|uniref:AMP-binding protein n=1 Tax=Pseudohoeflea coraliihabitans TaxID=2860393 RepID=A0ABS6WJ61_9HYPH|nr:AMP-binding protein [Pseudohoeflea sp. DP4N28-3]MBW3095976.1 AMP-binding protein [Pseudohoeflea sp. DP4N28-3]